MTDKDVEIISKIFTEVTGISTVSPIMEKETAHSWFKVLIDEAKYRNYVEDSHNRPYAQAMEKMQEHFQFDKTWDTPLYKALNE